MSTTVATITWNFVPGSISTLVEYKLSTDTLWTVPTIPSNPTSGNSYPITINTNTYYDIRLTTNGATCGPFSMTMQIIDIENACCPIGYTLSSDNTYCYQINTTAATPPSSPANTNHTTNGAYGNYGTLIFDPGYNINGVGTYSYINPSNSFWINPGDTLTDGPLNRTAVWVSPVTNNQDVGFTTCVTTPSLNTYYIGIGADNYASIIIDGQLIVQQDPTAMAVYLSSHGFPGVGTDVTFKFWSIYPVSLGAGTHVIEMIGHNVDFGAGMGCEVYNLSTGSLQAATSYTDIGSGLLFSSKDFFGQPAQIGSGGTGYSCPNGYSLSVCSGTPYCTQTLTTGTVLCPPSGTTSTTTTSTTTVGPTISGAFLLPMMPRYGVTPVGSFVSDNVNTMYVGSIIDFVAPYNFARTIFRDTTHVHGDVQIGTVFTVGVEQNTYNLQTIPTSTTNWRLYNQIVLQTSLDGSTWVDATTAGYNIPNAIPQWVSVMGVVNTTPGSPTYTFDFSSNSLFTGYSIIGSYISAGIKFDVITPGLATSTTITGTGWTSGITWTTTGATTTNDITTYNDSGWTKNTTGLTSFLSIFYDVVFTWNNGSGAHTQLLSLLNGGLAQSYPIVNLAPPLIILDAVAGYEISRYWYDFMGGVVHDAGVVKLACWLTYQATGVGSIRMVLHDTTAILTDAFAFQINIVLGTSPGNATNVNVENMPAGYDQLLLQYSIDGGTTWVLIHTFALSTTITNIQGTLINNGTTAVSGSQTINVNEQFANAYEWGTAGDTADFSYTVFQAIKMTSTPLTTTGTLLPTTGILIGGNLTGTLTNTGAAFSIGDSITVAVDYGITLNITPTPFFSDIGNAIGIGLGITGNTGVLVQPSTAS